LPDQSPPHRDRPIFVVGCPRSGTTLLQLMLHSHPRIAIPPETRIIVHAYHRRRSFGDLRRADNRAALARWVTRPRRQFGDLGLDTEEFIHRAIYAPGSLGSVIGTVFQMYAERHGKPRWGDKRPPYVRYIDVLVRLFPNAQIIHLVRDPRDCVASLKEMPWFVGGTPEAIQRWSEAIDFGRRAAQNLPADTYYELRYEDLTADPARELAALCGFLGERYDDAMCEPERIADVVPAHKTWHRNVRREVTASRVRSWPERLEPWEIGLCEVALGDRLEAHGYEPSGAPRPSRSQLRAYRKACAAARRKLRFEDFRDRIDRLREPCPVADPLIDTTIARDTAAHMT